MFFIEQLQYFRHHSHYQGQHLKRKHSLCFHKAFTLVRKDNEELIKSEVELSASLYVQCRS